MLYPLTRCLITRLISSPYIPPLFWPHFPFKYTSLLASDGGYTLLGLPPTAGSGAFEGVRWSDSHTCMSQKLVLESRGVRTRVGGTYHDVDEAEDVAGLERRAACGLAEVRWMSAQTTLAF